MGQEALEWRNLVPDLLAVLTFMPELHNDTVGREINKQTKRNRKKVRRYKERHIDRDANIQIAQQPVFFNRATCH